MTIATTIAINISFFTILILNFLGFVFYITIFTAIRQVFVVAKNNLFSVYR